MPLPESLPDWDDLPPVPGMPEGTAWPVWGPDDQLGALNLLTSENTLLAIQEVKSGKRVQLDWSLDKPKWPSFDRRQFGHRVMFKPGSAQDEVHYNTQSSTQWDGFKHIADPGTREFYQGLPMDDVISEKDTLRNGIHHWVEAGGIAGRGVLLDWYRWHALTRPGVPHPVPVTSHGIPVSELDAVAAFQHTELRRGDILIVRSGFTKWYNEAEEEARMRGVAHNGFHFIGVRPGRETKMWIWNHHFAAVAGDTVAFEQFPITDRSQCLHNYLLPLAGIPIGELFNLEELAKACEEEARWSFFFTSAPLNVPGGVASSPNAIAVL
ncbi:hypothetical protein DACRYDRAFT_22948 [Dacryopinax primogenitus]|uniref:Cyclase n=1 Tax=Dacryopinax primogenitus (strain DJM 731) TaxID=1858805 RepID=M5FZC1_DACPD|nr:uncharacterized protein DACRYDRAFT_22948 [Dacryopinax primogenitus]EJU01205.1 hypothetical protein DACRYDRAFT_22948 [Dacryopinax primogenitus]